jgi:hypothetical protein
MNSSKPVRPILGGAPENFRVPAFMIMKPISTIRLARTMLNASGIMPLAMNRGRLSAMTNTDAVHSARPRMSFG